MPLYYFRCPGCQLLSRKILAVEESTLARVCECGEDLRREPRPPTSQTVESLDNGHMPKRLERLADAERLFKERDEANKKNR